MFNEDLEKEVCVEEMFAHFVREILRRRDRNIGQYLFSMKFSACCVTLRIARNNPPLRKK